MTDNNKLGEWRRNDPVKGYYRYSAGEKFGQIRKARYGEKQGWYAELHYNDGTLYQYAGIWDTLKAAKEEIEFQLRDELAYATKRPLSDRRTY